MIFLLLFLDVILYNFTSYLSYFFIIYIYNKKYKYYLLTGLILDLIIFIKPLIVTLILSIIYLINYTFKTLNKNNVYNYIFINVFNYILFIILSNIILMHNFSNIFLNIGNSLFINIIFIILTFNLKHCN